MLRTAIILLAGQDTPEGSGRTAKALTATQEFQEAGDKVRLPSVRALAADGFQVIAF